MLFTQAVPAHRLLTATQNQETYEHLLQDLGLSTSGSLGSKWTLRSSPCPKAAQTQQHRIKIEWTFASKIGALFIKLSGVRMDHEKQSLPKGCCGAPGNPAHGQSARTSASRRVNLHIKFFGVGMDLEKQGLTRCGGSRVPCNQGRQSISKAQVCRRSVQPALLHRLAVLADAQLVQQQGRLISGRLPRRP